MNATTSWSVRVNDQSVEIGLDDTLATLLQSLRLGGKRGIAVAVNDSVIPRADWPNRPLASGDRVLVIQATQGG